MMDKMALETTAILGGSRHEIKGKHYVFLDFAQPKSGAAPHTIAMPITELRKLAAIAIQAVPVEEGHGLIADLVSVLNHPIPPRGDPASVYPYVVKDWTIGGVDGGDFILSLQFGEGSGSLSFRFSARDARQIATGIRVQRNALQADQNARNAKHPYLSVAEDIEWFRDEWVGCVYPPPTADLRRASGTLRHLLIYDALQNAWRHCGLGDGPQIVGPDLRALMKVNATDPKHVVSALSGGVELYGLSSAYLSLQRTINPTTGIGPDADEGFAVSVGHVSRSVVEGVEGDHNAEHMAIHRAWRSVGQYMSAPGAIRNGIEISRNSILTYFAHYNGGVHLDRAKLNPKMATTYALHEELDGKIDVLGLDGLHSELLAMGQAIGSSPDMLRLAKVIREAARPDT